MHTEPDRTSTAPPAVAGLRTPLWAHQRRALEFIQGKPGAMLAMDMRTGKTLVTIARIMADPTIRRALIICPLSVVGVWPEEFALHAVDPPEVVALNEGTMARRAALARQALSRSGRVVVVINHEAAWRAPFGPDYDEKGRETDLGLALSTQWDLVAIDESHKQIKSPGGRLSRFTARLRSRARVRLALTGTPMPHSPLDIFAQYRFLDPEIFGTNFHAFRSRYARMGGYENHQVVEWLRQDELNERMYRIAIRVKADDVLDMPPAVHTERYVDLGPKAAKAYRDLERSFYTELDAGTVTPANALVKLLRLQQAASGHLHTDDGEVVTLDPVPAKAAALADLLEDIPTREPVVVFTRFRHDLQAIAAVAERLGRRYGEVSGDRKDLVAGKYPPDVDLLGVQIQSGGVGIDLTRASTAVYWSMGFSLGDYLQSLARLRGSRQTRSALYVHLIASKTVDTAVYRALRNRQDVVEAILSDRRRAAA